MNGPVDRAAFLPADTPPDLHHLMPGTAPAVRQTLRSVIGALGRRKLCLAPDSSTIELVLAEILNNVVEHACADREGHVIGLEVWQRACDIWCRVSDDGRRMPGGHLPDTRFAPPESLPEGGFGWPLVYSLARDLHYERWEGRNIVTFRVSTTLPSDAAGARASCPAAEAAPGP